MSCVIFTVLPSNAPSLRHLAFYPAQGVSTAFLFACHFELHPLRSVFSKYSSSISRSFYTILRKSCPPENLLVLLMSFALSSSPITHVGPRQVPSVLFFIFVFTLPSTCLFILCLVSIGLLTSSFSTFPSLASLQLIHEAPQHAFRAHMFVFLHSR